jgi:PKD repeat protein
MGYNTVVIPSSQQVPVTAGDKFSVVVQVTNPTYTYYIPIEKNQVGYTSGIVSQYGQGYALNSGGVWNDFKTILDNTHICVKAYTGSTVSPALVANFTGTPLSGTAPLTVTFTDTSTGSPTSWSWSFGDGNFSEVKDPVYTYVNPSTYTVSLRATNAAGSDTKTAANYITVSSGEVAPVASFTGTPTSGTAPLIVTFTDTSTGTPTSWNWSFGDGNFSAVKNPVYTYVSASTYTVSLRATNAVGSDIKTVANYITVNAPSGVYTVGVFRNGSFYLKDATAFGYGLTGDSPIAGDWMGTGVDTGGVFRNGSFYLKDGPSFSYGLTGDKPVAGNWTGDRATEVGVFRDGLFFLRNSTGGTEWFAYGQAGDSPIAGDWNGDGTTKVGVFRDGVFYLRDSAGGTYSAFGWGLTGDKPVAGDWNGDGFTEVGVFRDGVFYLRDSTGGTYSAFGYGLTGDTPIAGKWT